MTEAIINLIIALTMTAAGLSVFLRLPGLAFLHHWFAKRRAAKKAAGKKFFALRQRLVWLVIGLVSFLFVAHAALIQIPNAVAGAALGVSGDEYASLKLYAPKDDFDAYAAAFLKAKAEGVKSVYEFADMKKRNATNVADYRKLREQEAQARVDSERQAKAAEEARKRDEKLAEDAKKSGMSVEAYRAKMARDEAAALALKGCQTDWRRCTDNGMLIDHYQGMARAKAACQIQAEKLAKFGDPQWDWTKFGTYFKGTDYVSKGVIRIQDPNVKFQNGFGAWRRTTIECFFDLKTETVDLVHAID